MEPISFTELVQIDFSSMILLSGYEVHHKRVFPRRIRSLRRQMILCPDKFPVFDKCVWAGLLESV